MALIPVPGGGGLVRDTTTGNVFTPNAGGLQTWRGQTFTDQTVKAAPLPEVPKADIPTITVKGKAPSSDINIPPPQPPPDVTDPGQPYQPVKAVGERQVAPEPPQRAQQNEERDGALLWLRNWKLSIGPPGGGQPDLIGQEGGALDLSDYAFEFSVEQSAILTPWAAKITIFNPDPDILIKMQKEMTHVVFEAGYRSPSTQYGKVFGGPIAYFRYGRQNASDTFVEIHAIQFDQPHNAATINTWIDAGHTKLDVVNACISALTPYGITLGQMPDDLGEQKSPRGRVLFGMVADILRDVGRTEDANLYFDQAGKLHMLRNDEWLRMQDATVPILNSRTGMIDVPTQTLGAGVEVTSLLNPAIIPGGQVRINEADITKFAIGPAARSLPQQNFELIQGTYSLNHDGYYTVIAVRHWGQNRGNPWYSQITTKPNNPTKMVPAIRQAA